MMTTLYLSVRKHFQK